MKRVVIALCIMASVYVAADLAHDRLSVIRYDISWQRVVNEAPINGGKYGFGGGEFSRTGDSRCHLNRGAVLWRVYRTGDYDVLKVLFAPDRRTMDCPRGVRIAMATDKLEAHINADVAQICWRTKWGDSGCDEYERRDSLVLPESDGVKTYYAR